MPERSPEIVRQRLDGSKSSGAPRLEERLFRFPRILVFLIGLGQHLPPGSRLRKLLLRRAVEAGLAALNRGEPEKAFSVYHPTDSKLIVGERFRGLAIGGTRGREARIRFQQAWNAEWGEFRFAPEELIDFGDRRGLVLGRIKGTGRSSGAGFDSEWAALFTVSGGWVVEEHAFWDRAEALEAAGLRE
jgi:ketosteroid isomerase-like protein